mgnify:CR=1 FL=1
MPLFFIIKYLFPHRLGKVQRRCLSSCQFGFAQDKLCEQLEADQSNKLLNNKGLFPGWSREGEQIAKIDCYLFRLSQFELKFL